MGVLFYDGNMLYYGINTHNLYFWRKRYDSWNSWINYDNRIYISNNIVVRYRADETVTDYYDYRRNNNGISHLQEIRLKTKQI